MRLFVIFLFVSLFGYCQGDTIGYVLSNGITGIYSRGLTVQYTLSYNGDNMVRYGGFSLNSVTIYSLVYGDKLVGNEFNQRTNIGDNNLFINHIYGHSLVRGILGENSIGVGYIYRFKYFSLSYGSLYQMTDNRVRGDIEIFRHSLRFKFKYRIGYFGISGEYYYQPNMVNIGDVIISGNIRVNIFQGKRVSLTMSDNFSYRSLSNVRLIHNILFGISINR